ncbi:QacE family quaternary ammonium compound efflux SMR transporter [Verrucomicrobia bacterium LW23]|nr:QacE family quaternary ammonium compound efflux SMR transporter [Verrucomicrobia bacterium LW23]
MFLTTYAALLGAIVLEIVATSCLQASQQFTRPVHTAIMCACYCASFYCLSVVLKTMPLGIAYATWCGVGISLIAIVGYVVFRQALDAPALLGIALITAGVVIINAFSKTASH